MIWRKMAVALVLSGMGAVAWADEERDAQFQKVILPLLDNYCFDCHEPGLSKGDVPFLETETLAGIRNMRGVWRSVASQLRNRTMPPPDERQPEEEERIQVANWIDGFLRDTACFDGPYSGNVTARRLNRLEYDNTVRDLIGLDLGFSEKFPMDGGTGEGFDNNGESLFLQPMLLERYLEAAQEIVDAVILTPQLKTEVKLDPKTKLALQPFYSSDAKYNFIVRVKVEWPEKANAQTRLLLKIDGVTAERLVFSKPKEAGKPVEAEAKITVGRGVHSISLVRPPKFAGPKAQITQFRIVEEEPKAPGETALAAHKNLVGIAPGESPDKPRELASEQLQKFIPRAFRRPLKEGEIDRFLSLYDRSAQRGDPWEESMKLALKGVFVAPDFLFRLETPPKSEEPQPITDHELASRLSYFLWATMPDDELTQLADAGKLRTQLDQQIDRLIDDPRSLVMVRNFVGQWLGTKEVGGRVAPVSNAKTQKHYTNEIAADLREEVVHYVHHLLIENGDLLSLVDSDYTYLTRRLGEYYQVKDAGDLPKDTFQKVSFTNGQRGGLLGSGAVMALTSHEGKTSPVLRGAWVFDTLIGEPVPPPPPNVPELPNGKKDGRKMTDREKLALHRDKASCMACHQIIDPIGFALQNYDHHGRWREQQEKQPIDVKGKLPTGESFNGPVELRKVLIEKRGEQMTRHITRKLLGYALGRSLTDRDDCTISKLTGELDKKDGGMRMLVKAIVNSTAFQNRQIVSSHEE